MTTIKAITRDELRKIQLDILRSVSAFCMKNNLTYFLCYGTLLGAVRHKGYIPWDDDIDIAMPRPDYEKFIRSFNKSGGRSCSEYGGGSCSEYGGEFRCGSEDSLSLPTEPRLKVISRELDRNFPYTFAKVTNTSTVFEEFSSFKYELG